MKYICVDMLLVGTHWARHCTTDVSGRWAIRQPGCGNQACIRKLGFGNQETRIRKLRVFGNQSSETRKPGFGNCGYSETRVWKLGNQFSETDGIWKPRFVNQENNKTKPSGFGNQDKKSNATKVKKPWFDIWKTKYQARITGKLGLGD